MNSNTKPNISRSKLCKQVAKVIGQAEAIKQLNIAYKSYNNECHSIFYWDETLFCAFSWEDTEQGFEFWHDIAIKLHFIKVTL